MLSDDVALQASFGDVIAPVDHTIDTALRVLQALTGDNIIDAILL